MKVAAWIRRKRDRPITNQVRHTAMVAITVLLATVTGVLTLEQPGSQASRPGHLPSHGGRTVPTTTAHLDGPAFTAEAQRVARRFLDGYLAYTYGQGRASLITEASPMLAGSLKAHRPRVPPAARARHPRVIALQPTAAPAGQVGVRVVVNDGGLIDYALDLTLTPQDGRLLVTSLDGVQ